jgi:hypothetical protein
MLDLYNWRAREWAPALDAAGVDYGNHLHPAAHGDHELACSVAELFSHMMTTEALDLRHGRTQD